MHSPPFLTRLVNNNSLHIWRWARQLAGQLLLACHFPDSGAFKTRLPAGEVDGRLIGQFPDRWKVVYITDDGPGCHHGETIGREATDAPEGITIHRVEPDRDWVNVAVHLCTHTINWVINYIVEQNLPRAWYLGGNDALHYPRLREDTLGQWCTVLLSVTWGYMLGNDALAVLPSVTWGYVLSNDALAVLPSVTWGYVRGNDDVILFQKFWTLKRITSLAYIYAYLCGISSFQFTPSSLVLGRVNYLSKLILYI